MVFVGAGPGADDLITVRGARVIAEADIVIWASSLVHPGIVAGAKPGAVIVDSAAESLEDMVDIAITECERFFPAFQFVLWGGKAPANALQAAMLDCVGEA